jgi:DNA topoisomerase-1
VGYKLSPFLWEKVKSGLSAGRVQSVATRIISEREDEIRAFVPSEYWTLDVLLTNEKGDTLSAYFFGDGEGRIRPTTEAEAEKIRAAVSEGTFVAKNIRHALRTRQPAPPFTTSTMQQEASRKLGFRTQRIMKVAQELYEGINIGSEFGGVQGLITYMRTDSLRISEGAQLAAKSLIGELYGEEYLPKTPRVYKAKASAQDAHEAIRPTDITRLPASVRESLSREQYRLYNLIWKRFVASRMSSARYETTQVRIAASPAASSQIGPQMFTVSASRLIFEGFQKVYMEDEEEKTPSISKAIDENTGVTLESFDPRQHYTQPLPHYTEATLVRALEEQGIGRPSTYAPTITTILARRYIVKEEKNLYMTELGEVVNNIMKQAFPTIVNPHFTANMETLLDGIADGEVRWKTVIENFYPDLHEAVLEAEKTLEKVKIADEETEEICENCGRHMVIKYGPHGKFLACPGFPECHNTKPYYEKIGVACPKCGKDIIVRMSKKGRRYYGCVDNPACDFMVWQKPSQKKCPRCGNIMLEKGTRLVCADKECGYVEKRSESEEE